MSNHRSRGRRLLTITPISGGRGPDAAMVDIALYENIRRMKDDFERLN